MNSLASGTSNEAAFRLIKVLLNTQQQDFMSAIAGDTTQIADIASEIDTTVENYDPYEKDLSRRLADLRPGEIDLKDGEFNEEE